MQVVRTIVWVLILVALLAFSFFNWKPVEVTIWENLVLETKVPALVIVSFLLGLVPTWLWSRGMRWSLKRKINSLETAARTNSANAGTLGTATPVPTPAPAVAPENTADSEYDYRKHDLDPAVDETKHEPSDKA